MHNKKFKKYIIIAVIAVLAIVLTGIVLISMAASWLFNRGSDEIKQAGQSVMQQAQPELTPPNLQSYIKDGQVVNLEQLQATYDALPSQLQSLWLNQFKAQIDELKNQAGVSDETIKVFTDLYNLLQQ